MKVFLTGATGFLGGELLIELSKNSNVEKIFCLVRAESEERAQERIKKVFAFHDDFYDEDKVVAIAGDLTEEFIIKKLESNILLCDVDVVIHSAANTSFLPQRENLVKLTNIVGAVQIGMWAKKLNNLNAFVYIGTAMSVGYDDYLIGATIHEWDGPNFFAKHLTGYTKSKMIAEAMLKEIMPREKLLVVRPSAVLGDSRLWKPRSFDISWVFAALNTLRLCPFGMNLRCDLVPVDYVCDAIVKLLFSKRRYDTYHISAGELSHSTMRQMLEVYGETDSSKPRFEYVSKEYLSKMIKWSKKKSLENAVSLGDFSRFIDYWEDFFGNNGSMRIVLAGMKRYFEFIELNQIFDNSRILRDIGLEAPPLPHEYFKKTVKYHIEGIDVVEDARNP